ncbi:MAG: tetratricopeptide repeat protein [Acidobacteria bacterium]|nr:tetratricopeptide repeat protein [Acidobacteriota bacterium]
MRYLNSCSKFILTAALAACVLLQPVASNGQDLVPTSSLTGGSSVFVFRSSSRVAKRPAASVARPSRTKNQQLETAAKIRRQYETIARVNPTRAKSDVIDPNRLPKNYRTLPAAQASKLFAGVGEYYVNNGDYDKALEFFRDSVSLDESNDAAKGGYSEALAIKGNDLLLKDQAQQAKAMFLEALKFDPKNSAAYFGLGEVYVELDMLDEAIANYERSLESNKDLTEIFVPLGILYYQTGEIAKADELLTKALTFSPNSSETQFFLGLIRRSQNRNEEALAAFRKARELDPTRPETPFFTGELLVSMKRTAESISEYQAAVALRPGYYDAWVGLAEAHVELGNFREAVEAYKAAAKLKNDSWEVFAGLADSYRQTNDFINAEVNYRLAATFYTQQPDFVKDTAADLYSKLGYVIGAQCDEAIRKFQPCKWGAAVRAMEQAVDLANNPVDVANLGWAYYNAARMDLNQRNPTAAAPNLEKAKAALERALAGAPQISDAILQNLGAVQIDMNDFRGAIDSLKPVVQRKPDWIFSRYALGTAYFRVNNFDEAAKMFRSVLELDPKNIPALSSLGYSEIKRKNGKEVRKVLEILRPLSPADAIRVEQEAKLAKVI